jgi:hypothetical protein
MTTPNVGTGDIGTLLHAPVSSTVGTFCLCWTARSYVRSVSKPGTGSSSRNCPIIELGSRHQGHLPRS